MPCILNVETSTNICSVALSFDGKVLFSKENNIVASHASLLGVYIAEAVKNVRDKQLRLDAVAVSAGPGSYTGLRIGVSEVKGLCYGFSIPMIAISSLKIMAKAVVDSGFESYYYCPMIDARRMEVYSMIYNSELNVIRDVSADIVDENTYIEFLNKGKMVFFGDGANKCKAVIKNENALFLDEIVPKASIMAILAEEAFELGLFEDVAYFEPFYLKDFIATKARNKFF